jgi:hypothetical protein
MSTVEALKARGFTLKLEGEKLRISPASKVTEELRAYIDSQRAKIVEELKAEQEAPASGAKVVFGDDVVVTFETEEPKQEIWADCYTPRGERLRIRCESEQHRQWVEAVNPPRTIGLTGRARSVLQATRYLVTQREEVTPQRLASHIPLSREETIGALSELERARYIHPGNWERQSAKVRLSRSGMVWVAPGSGIEEKAFARRTEPREKAKSKSETI